jgi:hypothetical protein
MSFLAGLAEMFSFTAITNVRSEAVMRRCQDKDFVHPNNFNGLFVVYEATRADRTPALVRSLLDLGGDRHSACRLSERYHLTVRASA